MIWLNGFGFVRRAVLLAEGRRFDAKGQEDENVGLGVDGAHVLLLFAQGTVVPEKFPLFSRFTVWRNTKQILMNYINYYNIETNVNLQFVAPSGRRFAKPDGDTVRVLRRGRRFRLLVHLESPTNIYGNSSKS